jgi:hypothetical protein
MNVPWVAQQQQQKNHKRYMMEDRIEIDFEVSVKMEDRSEIAVEEFRPDRN